MSDRPIIRPGPGRIAIQPVEASNEYAVPNTNVKLYVPSSASHEGTIGRVVAVCAPYQSDAGVEFAPNYSIGDLVIIGKFTGTRLNIGRESYTILLENDVLASIEMQEVGNDSQTQQP